MDQTDFDDDAAAMAQAMGFSSFGAQDDHPSKKRRYNPRADASADVATARFAAARPSPATGANAQEINLDDDENDAEDSRVPLDGPALAYTQTQIDEIIAQSSAGADTSGSVPHPPAVLGHGAGNGFSLPNRPNPSWAVQPGSPPQPAGRDAHGHGQGRRGGGNGQHQHGGGGDAGKPWWEDYYDTKSNENPWQHLEKSAGLKLLGSWDLKPSTSV